MSRLASLKNSTFDQVRNLQQRSTFKHRLDDKEIVITQYCDHLSNLELIVVVQAFIPTWLFPTFFSASGVGKLFVAGLVFSCEADVAREASDEELWPYR